MEERDFGEREDEVKGGSPDQEQDFGGMEDEGKDEREEEGSSDRFATAVTKFYDKFRGLLTDGYNKQKRLESEANIDGQIQDLSEEFRRKNEDINDKINTVKQTMASLVSTVGCSFPPNPDIHTTPKRKWFGESRLEDVVGEEEYGGVKGDGEDGEREKDIFFWGGDEEASAPRKLPFCQSREDQAKQGSAISTPSSATASTISTFASTPLSPSASSSSPRRTSTHTPMTPFAQENCSSSLQINMTVEEDGEEKDTYGEPTQQMPDYVD